MDLLEIAALDSLGIGERQMNIRLDGKWAIITGSSRGIGRAIALTFANAGANIILCGRSAEDLTTGAQEVSRAGTKVEKFCLEAIQSSLVNRFFADRMARIGRLDILVNNIGGVETFGSFLELSDDDWKSGWDLNLMSMVYFSRAAIPWLKKSEDGRIINIASVPARQPGQFNPHYSASKAAMLNLSKHLANLLAKDNILVNALCPSTLKGGGWERNVKSRADRLGISFEQAEHDMEAEEIKKVPLGRVGDLQDVAQLATFLASSSARFITGTCIDIDGGTVRSVF